MTVVVLDCLIAVYFYCHLMNYNFDTIGSYLFGWIHILGWCSNFATVESLVVVEGMSDFDNIVVVVMCVLDSEGTGLCHVAAFVGSVALGLVVYSTENVD